MEEVREGEVGKEVGRDEGRDSGRRKGGMDEGRERERERRSLLHAKFHPIGAISKSVSE